MLKLVVLIFLVIFLPNNCAASESHTNFIIKKTEACLKGAPIVFYATVSKENHLQYVDANMSLPFPLDDNIGMVCVIETLINPGTAVHLFTIRENSFCKAANKYCGEFWYDLERAGGIPPRTCPIPRGRYHLNHYLLDFDKMSLQTFPFGRLRFKITLTNRRSGVDVACLLMEVENVLQ